MSRLNPVYIGVFLLLLLIFFSFKLSDAKKELINEKEIYIQTKKLSSNLSELKKTYANKTKAEKSLQRIFKINSLKSANIKLNKKKTGINISSDAIEVNALNSLMSKLLNTSYNITLLKVKRLSDTKASLQMEIKW